jgi:hypothetical protein
MHLIIIASSDNLTGVKGIVAATPPVEVDPVDALSCHETGSKYATVHRLPHVSNNTVNATPSRVWLRRGNYGLGILPSVSSNQEHTVFNNTQKYFEVALYAHVLPTIQSSSLSISKLMTEPPSSYLL